MTAVKLFICLIATLALCFTYKAVACNNETTLKVGIGSSWPPYVMYGEQPYGIDVEITKVVFSQAGYCIDFVPLPSSARGITELEKGESDVLPSASFNLERSKVAYFSNPYRREKMRLFSAKVISQTSILTELFSLGFSFTANPGAYYGEELEQLKKIAWYEKRLFLISSLDRRIEMVAKERVDFMIEDQQAGNYYINQLGYKKMVLHPYVVNDNAIHFMLGRHRFSQAEVTRINQAINRVEDGIPAIIENY